MIIIPKEHDIEVFAKIEQICDSLERGSIDFGCNQLKDTAYTMHRLSTKGKQTNKLSTMKSQQVKILEEFEIYKNNLIDLRKELKLRLSKEKEKELGKPNKLRVKNSQV